MKEIVAFCEKTKEKTQASTTEIETTLKQQLKKDEYAEIQNTIKVNETAPKQILHQRKFKKLNILKYKPKPTVKTTNFTEGGNEVCEKSPNTARPTYAKILKDKVKPTSTITKPIKTYTINFFHWARQFEHAYKETSHQEAIQMLTWQKMINTTRN